MGYKFKNRYLICRIAFKDGRPIAESAGESSNLMLQKAIRQQLHVLFGDVGLGSALVSCQVKYVDSTHGICVVRCGRDEYRRVWLALSCIRDIEMRVCRITIIGCTGSVESCKTMVVEKTVNERRQQCGNQNDDELFMDQVREQVNLLEQ
jgi:ribonuclease P/MRP protein subunit POP5